MASFYYLISSLPLLKLGEIPLLDTAEFLAASEGFLTDDEILEIQSLSLVPPKNPPLGETSALWFEWETCLRNALIRVRDQGKNIDSEKFIRHETDFFSEISTGVHEAFSKPTPLEMENALDKLRWSKLDTMEVGHMFDFTRLCIYKIKLMLCEKQNLRKSETGSSHFDEIVECIYEKEQVAPIEIEA